MGQRHAADPLHTIIRQNLVFRVGESEPDGFNHEVHEDYEVG